MTIYNPPLHLDYSRIFSILFGKLIVSIGICICTVFFIFYYRSDTLGEILRGDIINKDYVLAIIQKKYILLLSLWKQENHAKMIDLVFFSHNVKYSVYHSSIHPSSWTHI